VDEWSSCLVYAPATRRLHMLDPHAWLILELCDGTPRARIAERYEAALGRRYDAAVAARHLDDGLASLARLGMIVAAAAADETDRNRSPNREQSP